MVVSSFLNPFCVPRNSSNSAPTHPIDDSGEVLHKLECVLLLEEVPLLLAPFHEVNGVNYNIASFQVREFWEGLVQEIVQNVAYQMLPTGVGVLDWVLRHPVSIGVHQILLVTLPAGCSSPGALSHDIC